MRESVYFSIDDFTLSNKIAQLNFYYLREQSYRFLDMIKLKISFNEELKKNAIAHKPYKFQKKKMKSTTKIYYFIIIKLKNIMMN